MHYICVHGVCHGGWCWEQTRIDLEKLGHSVSTPDLPLTSLEDDASAVRAVLDESAEQCVLVGHSYGGLVISKAACDRTDINHLVYIAAIMIGKDEVFMELAAAYPTELSEHVIISDDGTYTVDKHNAVNIFYNRCKPDIAIKAAQRLRSTAVECVATPAGSEPWSSFPSTYVLCQQDNAVSPELQQLMSKRAAKTVSIDTDHSPFYSSPDELLTILHEAGEACE